MTRNYLTLCALGASAIAVHGASIGINFGSNRANSALAPGDSAGVIAQANWNNAPGGSGTIASLNNDTGGASGVSLSWTADEAWSVQTAATSGPDGTLLNGFISDNNTAGNGATSKVDITGITYATYDLYIYISHDRSFEDVILSETGSSAFGPFTAVEDNTNPTAAVTWNQQTTSATGSGNYVLFAGLTASTLNIDMAAVDLGSGTLERNAISGIQIVQVPEPSSAALLGLAGLALFMRRRR
ncbi:MAG: PEP-CTERM sorting domain-containing protein [Akkermansiaceae bacterium]|nr:PEP-CTERM sorting domain-containing protein [Akkermansiaceae bacterium]